MNDKRLYEQILGINSPWHVEQVELKLDEGQIVIGVEGSAEAEICPECGQRCARYDASERRWRHLDTCQYQTILVARVPRIRCGEHGVRQVRVPWSEEDVMEDRTEESLNAFWSQYDESERAEVEKVAMDMWPPYITSTRKHLSMADEKIVYDNFHILKHLGDAVDKVRRREHRELLGQNDRRLAKTRYLWLTHPERLEGEARMRIDSLRRGSLRTARAFRYKEQASYLWGYIRRGMAVRVWRQWLHGALRCALEPIRVARMIKNHFEGVINAATSDITNAMSESVNSHIQRIKKRACGFRSRIRFREAILFHLGGLDLYPMFLSSSHSKP